MEGLRAEGLRCQADGVWKFGPRLEPGLDVAPASRTRDQIVIRRNRMRQTWHSGIGPCATTHRTNLSSLES
eukprot:9758343-Alexandrium_andersonii.AAC.1